MATKARKPAPMPCENRIGQRHEQEHEERRHAGLDRREVDPRDLPAHQEARHDQRRRRRGGRDERDERREHERREEEQPDQHGMESGARAFGDAGRRLDVRRRRAGTGSPSERRAQRVDGEDAADARNPAVGTGEPRGVGHGRDRPDRVEEIDEHDREEERQEADVEGRPQIEGAQGVELRPGYEATPAS